jgi:hypothetical protein
MGEGRRQTVSLPLDPYVVDHPTALFGFLFGVDSMGILRYDCHANLPIKARARFPGRTPS